MRSFGLLAKITLCRGEESALATSKTAPLPLPVLAAASEMSVGATAACFSLALAASLSP